MLRPSAISRTCQPASPLLPGVKALLMGFAHCPAPYLTILPSVIVEDRAGMKTSFTAAGGARERLGRLPLKALAAVLLAASCCIVTGCDGSRLGPEMGVRGHARGARAGTRTCRAPSRAISPQPIPRWDASIYQGSPRFNGKGQGPVRTPAQRQRAPATEFAARISGAAALQVPVSLPLDK